MTEQMATPLPGKKNQKTTFALIMGLLYILFGILQLISASGVVDIPLVPGHLMGIMVLIVIGAVYMEGYRELSEGIREGVAYVHVGVMLSLAFGILYLLVMGADAFSAYILELEDFQDWTIMDDMRPEFYLAFLSLVGYFIWKEDFKYAESQAMERQVKGEAKTGVN